MKGERMDAVTGKATSRFRASHYKTPRSALYFPTTLDRGKFSSTKAQVTGSRILGYSTSNKIKGHFAGFHGKGGS